MTKSITIRNSFHNTEVNLRPTLCHAGVLEFSPSQVRRAQRELCGDSNCRCGGALGQRGAQDWRGEVTRTGPDTVEVEFDAYTGIYGENEQGPHS